MDDQSNLVSPDCKGEYIQTKGEPYYEIGTPTITYTSVSDSNKEIIVGNMYFSEHNNQELKLDKINGIKISSGDRLLQFYGLRKVLGINTIIFMDYTKDYGFRYFAKEAKDFGSITGKKVTSDDYLNDF